MVMLLSLSVCSMRVLLLLLLSVLLVALAYRVHLVLQRPLPPGLPEPEKVRWLDETGRIALAVSSIIQHLGFNPAHDNLKFFINTVFSLTFNPLPWQRPEPVTLTVGLDHLEEDGWKAVHLPVMVTADVSQDVYSGVPVSVYTPHRAPSATHTQPTIVYFHGGGWTWMSVGVYDGPLKHLANTTRCKVIAVEYRKAPHHVFPAAYEDCLAVTRYVVKHALQLGVRQDAIMVAGDGAGGNLAAAVALALRDKLSMQILINPALQALNLATPSYQDNAKLLPGITSPEKEATNWLRYAGLPALYLPALLSNRHVPRQQGQQLEPHVDSRLHLPGYLNLTRRHTAALGNPDPEVAAQIGGKVADPRFCPMLASDVSGAANAYVIVSQYDVLRDEAVMYAHRLHQSKVKVKLKHYPNAFHGFFLFAGGGWLTFRDSLQAMDDLVDFINANVFGIY